MNYVLYGTEAFLIKKELSKIIKENVKQVKESVAYLDMKDYKLEDILDEAMMIPFFEDKKVMVISNCHLFDSKGTSEDLEILISYLKHPNPTTILVFLAETIDERKKLVKELKNLMDFKEFKKLDDVDRKQYILNFIKKNKIQIKDSAKTLLFTSLPENLNDVHHELEKLALYHSEIDEGVIHQLITRPLQNKVFDLVNAVLNRNMKKAMLIWQDFLVLDVEPLQIMGAFAEQFRFCYQITTLKKEGYSEREIVETLGCNAYRVSKTLPLVRSIAPERFLRYLNDLAQLDASIKSGRIDKKLGFELFLLKAGGKV